MVLPRLAFPAVLCALFAVSPAPPDDPPTLKELEQGLREPRPSTRRSAVRRLAGEGSRRAWELVVGALADSEPEVADEAQIRLGELSDERVLRDLLGRKGLGAREELVRLRAAEALGRVRLAVSGEDLAGAVRSRDHEVARTLMWSIERRARAGTLAGEPERNRRAAARAFRMAREGAVRGAALLALEAVDPRAALEEVPEALRDKRPQARCAAIAVAARSGDPAARDRIQLRLRDPDRAVRLEVVAALEAIADRAAARALVECLSEEPELRSRWRAVEALRRLSGLRYRLDPRPWKLWADGLEEGWRPSLASLTERPPRGTGSASFAGLPVLSERVCFLIDLSGSIRRRAEDGRTRKEVVDGLLRKALEGLPETTRFNLIPYTAVPHPWRERLQPASPRNVRAALACFEACAQSGRGAFYDAALLALTDPEVDTLIALTDGVPTGGTRWNMELMVTLLAERHRWAKVAIDSVLVDAKRGTLRHWERLADVTGGRSIAVEL